jgi:hypothetical protein
MPVIRHATNHIGEVWRKKRPTPRPMSVVPPIAHELLSFLSEVIIYYLVLNLKGKCLTKNEI